MNLSVYSFLLALLLSSHLAAQPSDSLKLSDFEIVDMEVIRSQTYLVGMDRFDCEEMNGSILEYQICANRRLQHEDSLLQKAVETYRSNLEAYGSPQQVRSFDLAQQLWERFRFADCSATVSEDGSRVDMIQFMECASERTRDRRRELSLSSDPEDDEAWNEDRSAEGEKNEE